MLLTDPLKQPKLVPSAFFHYKSEANENYSWGEIENSPEHTVITQLFSPFHYQTHQQLLGIVASSISLLTWGKYFIKIANKLVIY